MNSVYIATSLDGYIADKNGGIDFLYSIPEIENVDMGYEAFMCSMDALLMGRATFETVLGFDIDWPYKKTVYVLSNSLEAVPDALIGKAKLVKGALSEVLEHIHAQGHLNLYIDGGRLIQSLLSEDLIDEMIITIIPVLLGGGSPLFGMMENELKFELIGSRVFADQVVQTHYKRKR